MGGTCPPGSAAPIAPPGSAAPDHDSTYDYGNDTGNDGNNTSNGNDDSCDEIGYGFFFSDLQD